MAKAPRLFPSLASMGFEEMAFYGHIDDGFRAVKKYWKSQGRCITPKILWYYQLYRVKRVLHTALLQIRRDSHGCAEFRIKFEVGRSDFLEKLASDHEMTDAMFLGMFEQFTRPGDETHISVGLTHFTRNVKSEVGFFPPPPPKGLAFEKISLTGGEESTIQHLTIEQTSPTRIRLALRSMVHYHIERELLNERFFESPIQEFDEVTRSLTKRIKEWTHGKPFTPNLN